MIINTDEMTNDDKIKKGFELIFDGINSFHHDSFPKIFFESIVTEHRTLQQNFWRAMLATMKLVAEHNRFDFRNESSVNFCKKVTEFVKEHDEILNGSIMKPIVFTDLNIEFFRRIEENYPNISDADHATLLNIIQTIIMQSTKDYSDELRLSYFPHI